MRVWLNRVGDASTYTLCLVDVDGRGRPIPAPQDQPGRLAYRGTGWLRPALLLHRLHLHRGLPD